MAVFLFRNNRTKAGTALISNHLGSKGHLDLSVNQYGNSFLYRSQAIASINLTVNVHR